MSKSFCLSQFSLFKNNSFLFLTLTVILLSFSSCKNQKPIALNNGKCILDFKSARTLATNLKANEFRFNKMNAKLSAESLIDSTYNSFSITLRIKKDSVIWLSISKLGIEGARVLITKDSVKFVNKLSNKYFIGDFSYISKVLNSEMDFEILQSLLVGNSVAFYDEDSKLKPGADDCQYTLGTTRKYKLRRVERGKALREPVQSIYMLPITFKISRILFYEFNPERSLDVHYTEYTKVDSLQFFPLKANLSFKGQKSVNLDITYTKTAFDEEQNFPFKIPDDYEQITYNEKK